MHSHYASETWQDSLSNAWHHSLVRGNSLRSWTTLAFRRPLNQYATRCDGGLIRTFWWQDHSTSWICSLNCELGGVWRRQSSQNAGPAVPVQRKVYVQYKTIKMPNFSRKSSFSCSTLIMMWYWWTPAYNNKRHGVSKYILRHSLASWLPEVVVHVLTVHVLVYLILYNVSWNRFRKHSIACIAL